MQMENAALFTKIFPSVARMICQGQVLAGIAFR